MIKRTPEEHLEHNLHIQRCDWLFIMGMLESHKIVDQEHFESCLISGSGKYYHFISEVIEFYENVIMEANATLLKEGNDDFNNNNNNSTISAAGDKWL